MKRLDWPPALLANPRRRPDRDASLRRYADLAQDYGPATSKIREVRDRAIERLALRPGDTVFDVACGAGAMLRDMARRVGPRGRVIGIEQSPHMAALAREASNGVAQIDVHLCPVEEFVAPCAADALVFVYAHDVQQNQSALEAVFSRAKPGARVVVAGLCLLPWWEMPINAWVLWGARRYLTTWRGLRSPWQPLLRWCPDLRIVGELPSRHELPGDRHRWSTPERQRRAGISTDPGGIVSRVARSLSALLRAAAFLALSGCASTIFVSSQAPGDITPVDPPRYEAHSRGMPPPRVALVLSGGATRAFAHLGVLRVLEREGLRPDLVVGSSAGAMVGAYYASGRPVAEIEALAARVNLPTLIDIDPVKTLLGGFGGLGLAKGHRLEAFLRESIGVPLQSLPTRFVAVATDLNTGEPVLLNHGDTPRALRASSAMPGLYEPVHIGERVLGDGQIVSPMPIGVARSLGAQVVIGVDVVYPPQHASLSSPISVLFQTMTISTYRHLQREREQADLTIAPVIPSTSDLALSDREWLIAAGEAAAEKVLPALRAAFRAP